MCSTPTHRPNEVKTLQRQQRAFLLELICIYFVYATGQNSGRKIKISSGPGPGRLFTLSPGREGVLKYVAEACFRRSLFPVVGDCRIIDVSRYATEVSSVQDRFTSVERWYVLVRVHTCERVMVGHNIGGGG